jgi:hypothetical protein
LKMYPTVSATGRAAAMNQGRSACVSTFGAVP